MSYTCIRVSVVESVEITNFEETKLTTHSSFPINVNIEKNKETDQYEVEIRNFIG